MPVARNLDKPRFREVEFLQGVPLAQSEIDLAWAEFHRSGDTAALVSVGLMLEDPAT